MAERCGIYRIVNTVTNRTYIGSSTHMGRRLADHRRELVSGRHNNTRLQRSWNKHGEASFIFEELLECASDRRIAREQTFIDAYADNDMPLYNQVPCAPSLVGFEVSKEVREKIGVKHRGKLVSAATRAKIRAANVGKTMSVELREKISASHKGRVWSAGHRAKQHAAQFGRPVSLETREKMRTAMLQRDWSPSPETRAKQSAASKLMWSRRIEAGAI